ncbi:MAG: TonB-dependent receptor plug domain-containing protein [Steroidobacteraceae bacterium]
MGAAAPVLAQENLGEIVVTGSRIRSANLESTTPVTQVTAADVVTQGVTRIEDLVNQLPQAFAAQSVTVANGSTGTATLNLRGLGSPRTLVLVDGRRMPYSGVTNSAAERSTRRGATTSRPSTRASRRTRPRATTLRSIGFSAPSTSSRSTACRPAGR